LRRLKRKLKSLPVIRKKRVPHSRWMATRGVKMDPRPDEWWGQSRVAGPRGGKKCGKQYFCRVPRKRELSSVENKGGWLMPGGGPGGQGKRGF